MTHEVLFDIIKPVGLLNYITKNLNSNIALFYNKSTQNRDLFPKFTKFLCNPLLINLPSIFNFPVEISSSSVSCQLKEYLE